MAKSVDLYMDQGSDFVANMPAILDPSNSVINLTGYTLSAFMKRSYYTQTGIYQFTVNILNASQGLISLTMPSSQTASIFSARYVYDVLLTNTGTGISTKVFDGLIEVNPGITNVTNSYVIN